MVCIYYFQIVLSPNLRSCHPTLVMIYPACLDTRLELKCNSFCTPARVAINNHSKSFPITRNDLRLVEMNSSHSFRSLYRYLMKPVVNVLVFLKDYFRLLKILVYRALLFMRFFKRPNMGSKLKFRSSLFFSKVACLGLGSGVFL